MDPADIGDDRRHHGQGLETVRGMQPLAGTARYSAWFRQSRLRSGPRIPVVHSLCGRRAGETLSPCSLKTGPVPTTARRVTASSLLRSTGQGSPLCRPAVRDRDRGREGPKAVPGRRGRLRPFPVALFPGSKRQPVRADHLRLRLRRGTFERCQQGEIRPDIGDFVQDEVFASPFLAPADDGTTKGFVEASGRPVVGENPEAAAAIA